MFYAPAPEVEEMARELIPDHHFRLLNERVEYVFCDKVPKSKGKDVWASARKVSGLTAALSSPYIDDGGEKGLNNDAYFVIVVAEEIWQALDAEQRLALVDHELSHCWVDDEGELVLLGHDLEEFASVFKRHGAWREDIKQFLEKAQLRLFDDAAIEKERVAL